MMTNIIQRICLLGAFVTFATLFVGCATSTTCDNGMCNVEGVALSEDELRQRASSFAYDRLVWRQKKSNIPITGPNGEILEAETIDPASWDVSKHQDKWELRRHLTRDLWQVIECNHDGSEAIAFIEVNPLNVLVDKNIEPAG